MPQSVDSLLGSLSVRLAPSQAHRSLVPPALSARLGPVAPTPRPDVPAVPHGLEPRLRGLTLGWRLPRASPTRRSPPDCRSVAPFVRTPRQQLGLEDRRGAG